MLQVKVSNIASFLAILDTFLFFKIENSQRNFVIHLHINTLNKNAKKCLLFLAFFSALFFSHQIHRFWQKTEKISGESYQSKKSKFRQKKTRNAAPLHAQSLPLFWRGVGEVFSAFLLSA